MEDLETWRIIGVVLMVAAICAFWVLLVLGLSRYREVRREYLRDKCKGKDILE